MQVSARVGTATWRPTGPKTRPFRFGLGHENDDPALAVGTLVGDRYRIVGTLGAGGMGRVYEAEPVVRGGTSTRVALKILRRERSQGDHLARFRQEAKAAGRVGHPSIVEVLGFAELPDGTVYLAMERLYGQSFEDWLEAPGRLREGLVFLAEVARGLAAAHAVGIVHRDVKPANLFMHVDPELEGAPPRAKILDFGIAKAVTRDVTQIETQAGTLLGTPYYLAPERALGRSLDSRADLYSLGVILYEVLTGGVPFEDSTFMGILAQHIRAEPLDPRQAAPDRPLPPGVCMLAMRLLAKDPSQRSPDGNAVADEIEALLQREGALIDAVRTGPRQVAAAGDATVQLDDIAQRPTSAPSEASISAAERSIPSAATLAMGSSASSTAGRVLATGRGAATRLDGSADHGRPGASAALPLGDAYEGSGPMSFAAGPVARPEPRRRARWPLAVAIVAGVGLAGAAVAWALGRTEATTDEAAVAPVAAAEAEVEVEPELEEELGGEAAPPPTTAEAAADEAASTGAASGAVGETESTPEGSGSAQPPPTPAATTDATTGSDRRPPKGSRSKPRPKPAAPPPPDFKDDVYED